RTDMRAIRGLALCVGFLLLSAGALQAQTGYTVQPILRLGDPAGEVLLQTPYTYFDVETLNDKGQIVFSTADTDTSESLIQYSDGQFVPIVARGRPAPGEPWAQNVRVVPSVRMNKLGNVVFSAGVYDGSTPRVTSYLWESESRSTTPLIQPGT